MKRIELLAPAGNFEKLKTAFLYGADAAYLGGDAFGLRANAGNFTDAEIKDAVALADSLGKKVYVTMNIIARDGDLDPMMKYAGFLSEAGVHGVIVADLGVFMKLRKDFPELRLHVSTQANNLNSETVDFFIANGASRVNLARELSLDEIREINRVLLVRHPELAFGDEPYLEAFVHGAMCMAFSGRCMLSDYLAGRSSNRGDCAQPCRWNYAIVEEKRPGEYFPVAETDRGTFLFNSKDLCMIDHIPELAESGVGSLKIEGRMKSEFYTATTVRAYRIALDAYMNEPDRYARDEFKEELISEIMSCSHRDYYTGFYFGGKGQQIHSSSSYVRNTDYLGTVDSCAARADGGFDVCVTLKGAFREGEAVEIISPQDTSLVKLELRALRDAEGLPLTVANVPMMKVTFKSGTEIARGSMLRRRKQQKTSENQ
ncbi:MAG: U32 family peptidase [Clostridia bacterium]|nr:U32 family peptidase [Clostridia bacterium]